MYCDQKARYQCMITMRCQCEPVFTRSVHISLELKLTGGSCLWKENKVLRPLDQRVIWDVNKCSYVLLPRNANATLLINTTLMWQLRFSGRKGKHQTFSAYAQFSLCKLKHSFSKVKAGCSFHSNCRLRRRLSATCMAKPSLVSEDGLSIFRLACTPDTLCLLSEIVSDSILRRLITEYPYGDGAWHPVFLLSPGPWMDHGYKR